MSLPEQDAPQAPRDEDAAARASTIVADSDVPVHLRRMAPNFAAGLMRRVLVANAWLTLAGLVAGGAIGWFVAGGTGVLNVAIGVVLASVFAGLTALSMLWAMRQTPLMFFAVVLGAWVAKILVFLAVIALLQDAPFVHKQVLGVTMIAMILGQAVIDVVVVGLGRTPYVDPDARRTNP